MGITLYHRHEKLHHNQPCRLVDLTSSLSPTIRAMEAPELKAVLVIQEPEGIAMWQKQSPDAMVFFWAILREASTTPPP
jgi:hypothetical protein